MTEPDSQLPADDATVEWADLAAVEDCPPGTAIERVVAGQVIALFNVAGTFYALDGVCAHQGGPLGQGVIDGCFVTCPWHGWRFDIISGVNEITATIRQAGIRVRVFQDTVQIAMNPT